MLFVSWMGELQRQWVFEYRYFSNSPSPSLSSPLPPLFLPTSNTEVSSICCLFFLLVGTHMCTCGCKHIYACFVVKKKSTIVKSWVENVKVKVLVFLLRESVHGLWRKLVLQSAFAGRKMPCRSFLMLMWFQQYTEMGFENIPVI